MKRKTKRYSNRKIMKFFSLSSQERENMDYLDELVDFSEPSTKLRFNTSNLRTLKLSPIPIV